MASKHVGDLPPITATEIVDALKKDPTHMAYVVLANKQSKSWRRGRQLILPGGLPRLWLYHCSDRQALKKWVKQTGITAVAFGLQASKVVAIKKDVSEKTIPLVSMLAELRAETT